MSATPLTRRAARGLLYLAVLLALVPKGSTGGLGLLIACLSAGLAFLACAWRPPGGEAGRLFGQGVLLCLVLSAFVLFQATSWGGHPFAHPIWSQVRPLLGPGAPEAVSVAPGATLGALFSLVLPFLVYLAALALFDTDRAALSLWRFLAGLGVVFAVVGLLQLELAPDRFLFLFPKEYYRDSLTGFLVNRNTAGTLLGIAGLTLATLVAARPQTADGRPETDRARHARVLGLGLCIAIVLMALFLTKSRGALVSSFAAVAVFAALAVPPRMRDLPPGRRLLVLGLALAALALVVVGFGAQTIRRMQVQGLDAERLCVYRATWQAFLDNWRFGTGLGTFAEVFPAYRDPDCVGVRSLWTRAHNVWLEGLLVFGIGFVPLCLFVLARLAGVLRTGLRTRRRMRPFAAGGAGVLCLVVFHGFVDFSLQIPGLAVYAAAVLAAATTLCLQRA